MGDIGMSLKKNTKKFVDAEPSSLESKIEHILNKIEDIESELKRLKEMVK